MERTEENKNNKVLIILLIIIIVIVLLFLISKIFTKKVAAPVITDGNDDWETSYRVAVEDGGKDSELEYEYCVIPYKDTSTCEWIKTSDKGIDVTSSGVNYVYFRAISNNKVSDESLSSKVMIDNEKPIVYSVDVDKSQQGITIRVNAKDKLSGIKKYYYKIDNNNFVESNNNSYTFSNIDIKEIDKVTIKVVDKLDNEITFEKTIKESINKRIDEEENKEDTVQIGNLNTNNNYSNSNNTSKVISSSLVINPNGGVYSNSQDSVSIDGNYNDSLTIQTPVKSKTVENEQYNISFESNNGIRYDSITYTITKTTTYTFKDWIKSNNFKGTLNGSIYTFGNTRGITDTLTATYNKETTTEKSQLSLPQPSKKNYRFDGWYLNNNKVDDSFVPTKDTTLVAKWTLIMVDAEHVKENPKKYYGKTINNYNSESNEEYKIFYSDGTHIFLIASDYIKTDNLKSQFKGINGITVKNNYNIQLSTGSIPESDISDETKKLFMFNDYTLKKSVASNNAVTTLMNDSLFSNFVDYKYALKGIASPTLEMFVSSWNDLSENKLYYAINSKYGYYLGTKEKPKTYDVNNENSDLYNNKLYYPHQMTYNSCDGYHLLAPSAYNKYAVLRVMYGGDITRNDNLKNAEGKFKYGKNNYDTIGLRPVIVLDANTMISIEDDQYNLVNDKETVNITYNGINSADYPTSIIKNNDYTYMFDRNIHDIEVLMGDKQLEEGKDYTYKNNILTINNIKDNLIITNKPITSMITFNSNGGNEIEPIQVTTGTNIEIPIPEKEGYTFQGWYNKNKLLKTNTVILEDTEFTAQWKKK